MSSEMRGLVREMREALEGVVRVADRDTVEFDRARAAIAKASPLTFANAGDSEANFIADSERLNCPSCGGSGHVDDALLARTEAGADGAVAWLCEWTDEDDGETVRVSFEFKRGAENRALEVGGDARVIPLYTHPQDASGNAELIEAVGTYEEAVRLFGRTSPSASRAYCRMTDVLAAIQAKEAK